MNTDAVYNTLILWRNACYDNSNVAFQNDFICLEVGENKLFLLIFCAKFLQCWDIVGRASGRASGL